MAYAPAHPFVANDPLAYFAALTMQKTPTVRLASLAPADRALDLMYGYYSAE